MHINGDKLGRWSLRLDAAYCAALGTAVTLGAAPIARGVALPQPVIAGAGLAVVAWAAGVVWMLSRVSLAQALRLVMTVNVLAALAVGLVAATATTVLIGAVVLTVTVDIGLFAASQAVAVRALPARG